MPGARASVWTWAYGTAVALSLTIFVALHALRHFNGPNYSHRVAPLAEALLWIEFLLTLAWVYVAWSGLPPARRPVSARLAVLRLIVPGYNLYWVLRGTLALCAALDGILADAGQAKRAPRALGVAASIGTYVPLVSALLGAVWPGGLRVGNVAVVRWWVEAGGTHLDHVLWFAYAVACDEVRATATQLVASSPVRPLAAPLPVAGTTRLGRRRSRALIALWVVVAVGVLGSCWQALQPKTRAQGDGAVRPTAPP
jgi:hypothetical protein